MDQFFTRLDGFRHIPKEFEVRSTHGGVLTLFAWGFMIFLFACELLTFMSPGIKTLVTMDDNASETIEVYFDITMYDLPCRFVSVDLVDDFGEETHNVTTNIVKLNKHWFHGDLMDGDVHLDDEAMKEMEADMPEEIDRFHEVDSEGHHALQVSGEDADFEKMLNNHQLTFLNFYAPWCHWCKRLAPQWEKAAEEFDKIDFAHRQLDVKFGSIDCEKYSKKCAKYRVRAFPSLLMFKGKEAIYPFYEGERSMEAMKQFFVNAVHDYEDHMPSMIKNEACQVIGWLEVARVPGNFHIEAHSDSHDMSPALANLSHKVNHLSFGTAVPAKLKKLLTYSNHQFLTAPLDDREFIVSESGSAPTVFMKVVTIFLEDYPNYPFYEMTSQSRVTNYEKNIIPEARFVFDFSPLSVTISKDDMKWYQFLTSLLALIGGTFTVIQLFNSFVGSVSIAVKKKLGKKS